MSVDYRQMQKAMLAKHPHLTEPFKGGSFASVTFNLGDQVVTVKHRDLLNRAAGMCPVQATGAYDHRLGGHMVLWDLGIAIEFPPGAMIIFPSAVLMHSNTAIQPGEVRRSFTLYTAGALFRWKAYGFQLESSMKKNDPERKRAIDDRRPHAWRDELTLYSQYDELMLDIADVGSL